MSKSTDEFKALMETDRGEREMYNKAFDSDRVTEPVLVPLTRDGFEALLTVACSFMNLPVTNPLRNVLVGFLHHIENGVCETTIEAVGAALHKSMSNQCTWLIDKEIKDAANKELREEQEKLAKAALEQEKLKIKAHKEQADLRKAKKKAK